MKSNIEKMQFSIEKRKLKESSHAVAHQPSKIEPITINDQMQSLSSRNKSPINYQPTGEITDMEYNSTLFKNINN